MSQSFLGTGFGKKSGITAIALTVLAFIGIIWVLSPVINHLLIRLGITPFASKRVR